MSWAAQWGFGADVTAVLLALIVFVFPVTPESAFCGASRGSGGGRRLAGSPALMKGHSHGNSGKALKRRG
jgi:hypothetical protein